MAADTLLSVNNIEVVYSKTVQVLRGLSLKVDKGAVVALLGSNGAGKSTTLRAISNLLELEMARSPRAKSCSRGAPCHVSLRNSWCGAGSSM